MSATFDATTTAAYNAATTAAARAAVIVAALTGTVSVKVFNGSNVEMGSGTMAAPWATASAGVVTLGEVASFTVGTTATPAANWYIRFQTADASRWARGSFGLAGSGQDYTWSLDTWEAGQTGTIGAATIVAHGNAAPEFTVAPATASLPAGGGTVQFTAIDPDGGGVLYTLPVTRAGITIDAATGLVTVTGAAAGTSGDVTVAASDGILTTTHVCAITVAAVPAAMMKWYPGHYPYPDSLLLQSKISSINTGIDQMSTIPLDRARGVKLMVPWGQMEPTTRGAYTWTILDDALTRLGGPRSAPNGRVAFVDFWWQQFNTGGVPNTPQVDRANQFLPDYVIQSGWAYFVDSSDNLYVKMWLTEPVNEFIRFMQAVAARYDDDPRVAFMGAGEGSWGTPADGSISAEDKRTGTLTQMRRLMPAMRAAFQRTPFFLYNNFTGGQQDCGLLVQDQVDMGGGLGCPDVAVHGSLTPATAIPEQYSYRWVRGDRWNGSAWVVGAGPDQRMQTLCMTEKQVNRSMSWTPDLVIALAKGPGTYTPHVMCWSLHTTAYLREHGGEPEYRIPALDRANVINWFKTTPLSNLALRTDKPSTL